MLHRLLVVDDDFRSMQAIIEHSNLRGHTCSGVTDPTRVMNLARELRPTVVVCGLHLIRNAGVDILSDFKAEPRLASVPVILLAGVGDDYARAVSVRLGAAAMLRKPVAVDDLFFCIDEALGSVNPFTIAWRKAEQKRRNRN